MSRFVVQGVLNGQKVEGIWQSGIVTGDAEYSTQCAVLVRARAQVHLPGLIDGIASTEEPMIALATMLAVLDVGGPVTIDGDAPNPEPVPKGAIV